MLGTLGTTQRAWLARTALRSLETRSCAPATAPARMRPRRASATAATRPAAAASRSCATVRISMHRARATRAHVQSLVSLAGAGSLACSAGSYSGGGGAACTPCPSGSNSSAAATSCLCLPGFQVDALGTGCTGTRMINRSAPERTGVDEFLGAAWVAGSTACPAGSYSPAGALCIRKHLAVPRARSNARSRLDQLIDAGPRPRPRPTFLLGTAHVQLAPLASTARRRQPSRLRARPTAPATRPRPSAPASLAPSVPPELQQRRPALVRWPLRPGGERVGPCDPGFECRPHG